MEHLKYPIGRFSPQEKYSLAETKANIKTLVQFPARLKVLAKNLTDIQLDTPYRPEGWTVRQVIHHVADSHANMLIRLKLALTEENPTIKPYEEQLWAELPDYKLPIRNSISLIELLHKRLGATLKGASKKQLDRTYYHPGNQKTSTIHEVLAMYVWHSEHHYQHINQLIIREKW